MMIIIYKIHRIKYRNTLKQKEVRSKLYVIHKKKEEDESNTVSIERIKKRIKKSKSMNYKLIRDFCSNVNALKFILICEVKTMEKAKSMVEYLKSKKKVVECECGVIYNGKEEELHLGGIHHQLFLSKK